VVENAVQRRLAAILAADVVGYSRLMGANEVGTLAALKAHRKELVDSKIAEHHGRTVKLTGDGMLVEFSSVVSAVSCAVEIQRRMRERNAGVSEDRRIEFRIGINLGDIILEDNDIFGDGVNIAARIESIAKPGGVAVSGSVRDNVGNKLDLMFEDAGEQALKNIERPVRVYNVSVFNGALSAQLGTSAQTKGNFATAEKLSIAVLPFTNMSGDPEQEYFSDGITEDIITDLAQISGLFVVGRNSVFTYKGKSVNLVQAAKELGVRYLLEGSVRKAKERVRITSQLIDGANGGHLWAARYDRDLTDIFAVQDEIAHMIVDQLKVKLRPEERKAIDQSPTGNVEAYNFYLRGRQFYQLRGKESLLLARQMFAKAVELDPLYARAYAGMADCDSFLSSWLGIEIPTADILATTGKALAIDPNLAEAHAMRGVALINSGRRKEAISAFEQALALDPNSYGANYFYARFCFTEGDLNHAVIHYIRALEIQHDDYKSPCLLQGILQALGRRDEAERYARLGIKRAEESLQRNAENFDAAALGASILAAIGEHEKAKEWLTRALTINNDPSNSWYNVACTYSLLGDSDRAIDLLEIWLPKVGPDQKLWIAKDSDLDPIRNHPRFQKLLELAG
jgi:adenylate cyclase